MEKRVNRILLLVLFGILCLSATATAATQHGFSVKQYEEFHEVLHPLEHDALPKKDFQRIRNQAGTLVKHGKEIVALGVPAGVAGEQEVEFKKELAKFNGALNKFRSDARRGSTSRLKTSYSAVHDSFEMLASLLPRK